MRSALLSLAAWTALATLLVSPPVSAATPERDDGDATYRGRVLTERFRHRQALARRPAVAALSEERRAPRQDRGEIAVIDTSGGVVADPNFFDLERMTVRLTPTEDGAGFSGETQEVQFDQAARNQGLALALGDDDAERVTLPFAFPYFGETYSEVWVNSDGNLTFGEGDARSAGRTLARATAGPPRVCPLYTDLDPSRLGAQVRFYALPDRVVVTWDAVPEYTSFGNGRRQTFQVELRPDGRLAFHLLTANLTSLVLGVFPGDLGDVRPVDLSEGFSGLPGGAAELFELVPTLDPFAATQQFYRNHGDAYDFFILFNNFGLSPGPGAFAFEINVRNEIRGIGDLLLNDPVFDLGGDFGSPRRLASFVNMGPLSSYPSDPTRNIPVIGENSTLSLLGQEAGHRWGIYVDFLDPATGLRSSALLGRQQAHWSFFFHSEASVLEGNAIVDQGEGASPRFETVDAVSRFGTFDRYLMGLIPPEAVGSSFLVTSPTGLIGASPSRSPQTGVTFSGDRKEIPLDAIIAAEGPRLPDHSVASKEFRFAFVLLVDDDEPRPSSADIAKLEAIRAAWGPYFEQAVDGLATGRTDLVDSLELSAWPALGVVEGGEATVRVSIDRPRATDLDVELTPESGGITAPATVRIPAGQTSAEAAVTGNAAGVYALRAAATEPGFDSPRARIRVLSDLGGLRLVSESGDGQAAEAGARLAEALVVRVVDAAGTPYSGVELVYEASDDGAAVDAPAVTDLDGRARFSWRLSRRVGENTLHVSLADAEGVRVRLTANGSGDRPVFSAAGVVNAASLGLGPAADFPGVSGGSLVSIFGKDFGTQTARAEGFPLPRTLAGVQVRLNGVPIPLLFVSPGQINGQMPFEAAGDTAVLEVLTPTANSQVVTVPTARTQPGVFFDAASGYAAAVYGDGLVAWRRAARPGEAVQLFATGLGPVEPRTETGEAAPGFVLSRTTLQPTIRLGGRVLSPLFSGLAPLFAGLYQVNFVIPVDLPPGAYEVQIEIDGRLSNLVRIDVE